MFVEECKDLATVFNSLISKYKGNKIKLAMNQRRYRLIKYYRKHAIKYIPSNFLNKRKYNKLASKFLIMRYKIMYGE